MLSTCQLAKTSNCTYFVSIPNLLPLFSVLQINWLFQRDVIAAAAVALNIFRALLHPCNMRWIACNIIINCGMWFSFVLDLSLSLSIFLMQIKFRVPNITFSIWLESCVFLLFLYPFLGLPLFFFMLVLKHFMAGLLEILKWISFYIFCAIRLSSGHCSSLFKASFARLVWRATSVYLANCGAVSHSFLSSRSISQYKTRI